MEHLFTVLTDAVQGSAFVAAGAAFAWGVLSIVLSPCHLASIPLIVAFIGEQEGRSTRRAFAIALVFAAGILLTIAAIGGVTAALGRMLGDIGRYGNYAIALIFLLLGLHFLGVFPLPWSGAGPGTSRRKGLWAALVLGLIFGVGVGPCTFAYMAPMLGVTFKVAAKNLGWGMLLLLLYGLGHCAVIVAAGTSAQSVQRYLNWTERSRGAARLRQACGVLVILAGIYLVYITR
ncbi:MAG: cytochrome c biogenesis protein CcdA [Candidatus Eisenbacteria bacterium]